VSDRGAILIVSPYRVEYGPPQTLEHVSRAVLQAGYRPVCVVPPGAHITSELERLGPSIHVLDGLATFPRTLNVFRLATFFSRHLRATHRLERIAAAEGVRAVFSISEATFAGSLAARRLGIPSIVHVIGMSIRSPRVIGEVYVRFLAGLTDLFIACSAAVAYMLTDFGVTDDRVAVVHNGIDVGAIEAANGLPPAVEHDGPRVGVVAAYDPRKGHELFVEAAALVARDHPDARFYLIGGVLEGHAESVAFERRVETLIERLGLTGRVERTGFVPAPDVYRWIRDMDVVVVPSRTEAFAHALPEAMVCRRAVVATRIEGNLDAFADGHSGVYVERDATSLAAAVDALLRDPDRRRALGDAAHERAAAYFDLDVMFSGIAYAVRHRVDGPPATA
jgi:glycosyltransferase involved in cell wall biosynthesis